MQLIKWFAIAVAIVILLPIVGCIGTVGYFASAPKEVLTAGDIEPGARSHPGEREALIRACNKKIKDQKACVCIADEAEDSMSRFERLAVTAVFDGDLRRVVGFAKGLAEAGVTNADIQQASASQERRLGDAMRRCAPAKKTARR